MWHYKSYLIPDILIKRHVALPKLEMRSGGGLKYVSKYVDASLRNIYNVGVRDKLYVSLY
jgi:hypothetical protein